MKIQYGQINVLIKLCMLAAEVTKPELKLAMTSEHLSVVQPIRGLGF